MTSPARQPVADDDDLDQDGYYLVIPDEVVQSATQHTYPTARFEEYKSYERPNDDFDDDEDEDLSDYAESGSKPLSRNAVSMIGGVTASLVTGMIPSLIVAPPASLVSGVAAGVFGGLMGASLANEFYDRRHRD